MAVKKLLVLLVMLVPAVASADPGSSTWRTAPKADNGFYPVIDGLCSDLAADRVGSDVVVHYGGPRDAYIMLNRTGDASFMGLRGDALVPVGDPHVGSPQSVTGKSLEDFWIGDGTGSRSGGGTVLHRLAAGTWSGVQKDDTGLQPWMDGGVIGALGFAMANGELWVEGSATKPPPASFADMWYPRFAAFPSGELLVVGKPDRGHDHPDAPLVARHWAPGQKVTQFPLESLLPARGRDWTSVAKVTPDEVYVTRGDHVVRWNGTSFKALSTAKASMDIDRLFRLGVDDVWVMNNEAGTLQHLTATDAKVIATPEPVADIDGVDIGSAWMVGRSGKLYRRDGDDWKPAPLPSPVYTAGANLKAKRVLVMAKDEVLVTGMYWEKGVGWTEQELHTVLFRTKAVKETLRCNEPDPENNNAQVGKGFQSWPAVMTSASPACATPFAVLARRSNAPGHTSDDDWPRIRGALKGHPELGEVSLVDFVSGDRTFVGVKAKDYGTAKKIATLAAGKDRLRPEIVCAEPLAKRVLALDLATGAVKTP